MGGLNSEAIKYVLELENIPLSKHTEFVRKISKYVSTALNSNGDKK